jgi:hypothetical protein
MFTMVNHSLRETHAFMPATHTGHGRFKVKSEEEIPIVAHTNQVALVWPHMKEASVRVLFDV